MLKRVQSIALVGFLLSLVACGPREQAAPDYDRLYAMQLRELFRAIADGEHELAIRKIERLTELSPESPGIHDLLRLQVEGVAFQEANDLLAEQDLDSALTTLRTARMKHGSSPRLDRGIKRLEGLRAVRAYRQRDTFSNGRELAQALAQLPEPTLYPTSEAYARWHAQQRQRAAERLAQDKAERLAGLVAEVDRLAVTNGDPQAALESLLALAPDHPLGAAWAHSAEHGYRATALPENMSGMVQEVIWFLYHRRGPVRDRPRLEAQALAIEPVSISGRYLQAIALWNTQKRPRAILLMRQLQTEVPDLNASAFTAMLNQAIEASDSTPSLSVLGLFESWQEIMGASAP